MKTILLLACVLCAGCANFQSNLNNGLAVVTNDVNKVAVAAGTVGKDAVTVGTTAVNLGTDVVKVSGAIATATTSTPAPAASTGT